jgi:hypothetical protein
VGWGYFATGVLWDWCIVGRRYSQGYCRVRCNAVGSVMRATEGRGILWARGTTRGVF